MELAFFAAGFAAGVFRSDIFNLAKSAVENFQKWRAERAKKKEESK